MPPSFSAKRRKAQFRLPPSSAPLADLSRHLMRAQEEERKRISRELHDGAGQGLMVLRLYLGMLASESQSPESLLKIEEALKLLDHTVEDLRRIIGRLSPRTLEELGLIAAIRKEAHALGRNTGMKFQLHLAPDLGPLDHEIEVALYRSLQEALHNIAKHSQAQNFTIHLRKEGERLCLSVEDDGIGFSRKRGSGLQTFGILGMRERVAALGGKMRIRSVKGSGTQVKISVPGTAEPIRKPAVAAPSVRPAFAGGLPASSAHA